MARSRRNKIHYADHELPQPASASQPRSFIDRWYGKLLLLLISVILLTLSYAPFKQFWAGWIGVVPLIVVLGRTAGPWRGAFWWWLAGVLFFSANVWWLLEITGPGVVALVLWLGLYWALAAVLLRPLVRALQLATATGAATPGAEPAAFHEPAGVAQRRAALKFLLLFPVIWVGAEWIRGNWPFQGLSWFNLSYAQTPALYLCQIADIFGEHGISFWVAMINALAALFVLNGWRWRGLLRPVLVVCGAMLAIGVYGVWRFVQTESMLTPGPMVLVVQPNVPQSNQTGEKDATPDELIDFHVSQTNTALQQHPETDLAVWSETMMPPMNEEFLVEMAHHRLTPQDTERARRQIAALARHYKVSLLVGGSYVGKATVVAIEPKPEVHLAGRRNSAYYFMRDSGQLVDRFDKVHLVPFGEYIPFQQAFPWLYRQLIALGPVNMESYQLDRGERAVIFELPRDRQPTSHTAAGAEPHWRFVTPICFEDADAELNAWFFRGGAPRGSIDQKKADFIVNVSNDGWFELTMMPQHLQVGTLRSIENRVPTARSVNTGISGFIDSLGRTHDDLLLRSYTEGTLTHRIMLDRRTTFFTRWGNILGPACAAGTGLAALVQIATWWRRRRGAVTS